MNSNVGEAYSSAVDDMTGDRSPYVILSIFSVFFSRFHQQNRRVLDQLPIILGHLYYFLYLSL